MAKRPTIVRTVPALRRALQPYRRRGQRIALVPTMGALHRGHLALVRQAQRRADRVVVSIFVNPTQFAPHEDFGSYPRRFETDIKALSEAKVDLVWAPSAAVMYPQGFATRLAPEGAAKPGLEDKFRPPFFGRVAPARLRPVRREALPAAARRHPDGQGSRSAAQGDRRADGARAGRPRAVVAQPLPLGQRASRGADALSCAQGRRGAPQAKRAGRKRSL